MKKRRGLIIRSRAQYAIEGERCTSFFLGMEKKKQSKCYVDELENEKGEVVNDFVSILEMTQTFYKNLKRVM